LASSGQEGSTDGGRFAKPFLQQTITQRLKDQPVAPKTQVATPTKTLGDYVNPRTMTPGLGDAVQSTGLMAARVAKEFNSKSTTGTLLGNRVQVMDGIAPKSKKPIGDIRKADMSIEKASSIQEQSKIEEEARVKQEKENLEQQKADASVSAKKEDDGLQIWDRTKSALSTLGKSVVDGVFATGSKQVAILSKTIDDEFREFIGEKPLNKPITEYQTYKWAKDIESATQKTFNPNKAFEGEIQETVAQTAGDLLGLVATAFITKNPSSALAKMGTKEIIKGLANTATRKAITKEIAKESVKMLAKPTTFVAAAQTGTRNYDEALEKGATEDEANAMYWSTAVSGGLINNLPVGSLLNRIDKASGGKMKQVIVGGVVGGAEEAVTEGVEQMFNNFAAKNIYDETRSLFEGLGESAAMGGGIGFVLNSFGVKLGQIRNKYKNNPEKVAEVDQAIDFIKNKAEVEGQMSAMKFSKSEQVKIDKFTKIIQDENASDNVKDIARDKLNEITGSKIIEAEDIQIKLNNLPEDKQIEVKLLDAEIEMAKEASAQATDVDIKDEAELIVSKLENERADILNTPQTQEGQLSSGGQGTVQEVSNNLNNQVDEQTKADVQTEAEAEAEADVLKTGEADASPEIVTQGEIEAKKADIERRRQEELNDQSGTIRVKTEIVEGINDKGEPQRILIHTNVDGSRTVQSEIKFNGETEWTRVSTDKVSADTPLEPRGYANRTYDISKPRVVSVIDNPESLPLKKVNAKYDAELAALKQQPTSKTPPALANVESTAKALEGKNTGLIEASLLNEIAGNVIIGKSAKETISEAYHKAKKDGSNPELVKAVEELLVTEQPTSKTPKTEAAPIEEKTKLVTPQDKVDQFRKDEQAEYDALPDPNDEAARKKIYDKYDAKITPLLKEIDDAKAKADEADTKADEAKVEQIASTSGTSPKNIRELYKVNRNLFGLDRVKAFASAVAMDRMVGAMAKRAKITKTEMYGRLKFEKAAEQNLPNNALMQGINSALYELSVANVDITNLLDVLDPDTVLLYNDFAKKAAELQKKYDKPINEQDAAFVKSFRDNLLTTIDSAIDYWESAYKQKSVVNKEGDLSQVKVNLRNKYKERVDKLKSSRDVIAEQLLSPQDIKMSKMGSVLFQLDAWHASPFLFDKFSSLYQGKGVGASRSGVGIYFAIDKKRAEGYAKRIYDNTLKIGDITVKEKGAIYPKGFYQNLKKAFDKSNGSRITFAKELLKIANEKRSEGFREKENFISISLKNGRLTEQQVEDYDFELPIYVEQYFIESSHYREFAKKALKTGVEQNEIPAYLYAVTIKENGNWLDFNEKMTDEQYDAIVNQAKKENSVYLPSILEQGKNKNNRDFYWNVGGSVTRNERELSNLLMRAGIDGNVGIEDGNMVEYVVFDENAVSIEEVIKFQKDANKARGAAMVSMDGQAVIYALSDPNVSTPLHELAHVFEHYLTDAEKAEVIKSAKTKDWNVKTSEYFARGFEKYLAEGKSPIAALDKVFAKFKEWLTDIYNGIKGSDIDIKLNKQMREIYASMLGKEAVLGTSTTISQSPKPPTAPPVSPPPPAIPPPTLSVDSEGETSLAILADEVLTSAEEVGETPLSRREQQMIIVPEGRKMNKKESSKAIKWLNENVVNPLSENKIIKFTKKMLSTGDLNAIRAKEIVDAESGATIEKIKSISSKIQGLVAKNKSLRIMANKVISVDNLDDKVSKLALNDSYTAISELLNNKYTPQEIKQATEYFKGQKSIGIIDTKKFNNIIKDMSGISANEISEKRSENASKVKSLVGKILNYDTVGKTKKNESVEPTLVKGSQSPMLTGSKLATKGLTPESRIKNIKTTTNEDVELKALRDELEALPNGKKILKVLDESVSNKKVAEKYLSGFEQGRKILEQANNARELIDSFADYVNSNKSAAKIQERIGEVISGNKGSYLKRSFKFWKDKSFEPSEAMKNLALESVVNDMMVMELTMLQKSPEYNRLKGDAKQQYLTQIADDVRRKAKIVLNTYLDEIRQQREEGPGFFPRTTAGKINGRTLEFRKLIDESFLDLLGNINDPISQFHDTVLAQTQIKAAADFHWIINNVTKKENIFDSREQVVEFNGTSKGFKQLNDKNSLLNGKWVSEDIFDIISSSAPTKDGTLAMVYRKTLSTMRKSKTIYNFFSGWTTNLIGGQVTLGANGIVTNPKDMGKYMLNRIKYIKNPEKLSKDIQSDINAMKENGFWSTSVSAGTIKLLDDNYMDMTAYDRGNEGPKSKTKKVIDSIKNNLKRADDSIVRNYAVIDDFTKLVFFREKKDVFSRKLFGKKFDSLTKSEQDIVHANVAERGKQNIATMSRLPRIYDKIAKVPFGDFLAFRISAIKSGVNTISNLSKDINTGLNDKTISKEQRLAYLEDGFKTFAGMATAAALNSLFYGQIASLAMGLLSDKDEEIYDRKKDEDGNDIGTLADLYTDFKGTPSVNAQWMRGKNNVVISDDGNGNIELLNISNKDPYDELFGAFLPRAGTTRMETIAGILKETGSPNMTVSLFTNIIKGEDQWGRDIYSKDDTDLEVTSKIAGYLSTEALVPPAIKNLFKESYKEIQQSKAVEGDTRSDIKKKVVEKGEYVNALKNNLPMLLNRTYKNNISEQLGYYAKDFYKSRPEKFAELSREKKENRYNELERIKDGYDYIKKYSILKKNPAFLDKAREELFDSARGISDQEKNYILFGEKAYD
jgi:hypothetical protein